MNEQPNNGNIILYQTEDGKSRIEVIQSYLIVVLQVM